MTNEPPSDLWDRLIPSFLHPLKVAIIETLLYLDLPLSASELHQIFGSPHKLPTIAYHVRKLTAAGVLEVSSVEQVRGAIKKTYMLK